MLGSRGIFYDLADGPRRVSHRKFGVDAAVNGAGGHHALGQLVDLKNRALIQIAEPGATLARQLVGGHVTHRGHQQIAAMNAQARTRDARGFDGAHIHGAQTTAEALRPRLVDRGAALDFHAGIGERTRRGMRGHVRAHLHHAAQLDPGLQQVKRNLVGDVVAGQHHRAVPGSHAVASDQSLGGASQQDPGQVVVTENRGLFDGTGAHAHRFCPDAQQAFALDDRYPVILEPAIGHRTGQAVDTGMVPDRVQQRVRPGSL